MWGRVLKTVCWRSFNQIPSRLRTVNNDTLGLRLTSCQESYGCAINQTAMACQCSERDIPCFVECSQRTVPYDQPLSIQTSLEYELDYSLFKGYDPSCTEFEPALVAAPCPTPSGADSTSCCRGVYHARLWVQSDPSYPEYLSLQHIIGMHVQPFWQYITFYT